MRKWFLSFLFLFCFRGGPHGHGPRCPRENMKNDYKFVVMGCDLIWLLWARAQHWRIRMWAVFLRWQYQALLAKASVARGWARAHKNTEPCRRKRSTVCLCCLSRISSISRGNAGGKFFVLPKGKKIEPSCVKWALGCVRCVGFLLAGKAKRMLSSFAHVACSLMGIMCTTRTGWLRDGNYLFINISATWRWWYTHRG